MKKPKKKNTGKPRVIGEKTHVELGTVATWGIPIVGGAFLLGGALAPTQANVLPPPETTQSQQITINVFNDSSSTSSGDTLLANKQIETSK